MAYFTLTAKIDTWSQALKWKNCTSNVRERQLREEIYTHCFIDINVDCKAITKL